MRFLVLVPASKNSEAGVLPPAELDAEMQKYHAELVRAGIVLGFGGLQPTSKAVRVVFNGSKQTVVDGPFTESKELIGGYWIWDVRSREEAVEWLKRAPFAKYADEYNGEPIWLELRPLYDASDPV